MLHAPRRARSAGRTHPKPIESVERQVCGGSHHRSFPTSHGNAGRRLYSPAVVRLPYQDTVGPPIPPLVLSTYADTYVLVCVCVCVVGGVGGVRRPTDTQWGFCCLLSFPTTAGALKRRVCDAHFSKALTGMRGGRKEKRGREKGGGRTRGRGVWPRAINASFIPVPSRVICQKMTHPEPEWVMGPFTSSNFKMHGMPLNPVSLTTELSLQRPHTPYPKLWGIGFTETWKWMTCSPCATGWNLMERPSTVNPLQGIGIWHGLHDAGLLYMWASHSCYESTQARYISIFLRRRQILFHNMTSSDGIKGWHVFRRLIHTFTSKHQTKHGLKCYFLLKFKPRHRNQFTPYMEIGVG